MVKPKKANLYFDYKCDSCAAIHQLSYSEVLKVGKVLCFCGKLIKCSPFKAHLKLEYQEKKPKVSRSSMGQSAKITNNRSDVINALCIIGYSKGEAGRIVKSYDDGVMSDESLIKRCLKNDKTNS